MYSIQLCTDCPAETKVTSKVVNKQGEIDPADAEVIENLDLLQNWDIVGPQGPDMKKINILNTLPLKGASHDK